MKWSISAHNTFRRCQRQYFFSEVMASPQAKDTKRREAYMLKQLKHLSAWQGSLVHQAIDQLVVPAWRSGSSVDARKIVEYTLAIARRQLAFSESHNYQLLMQRSKTSLGSDFLALFEHEYGIEVLPSDIETVYERVSQCFQNLSSKRDFVSSLRNHFDYESELPLHFKIDAFTVAVKLDLLCSRRDGRPTIVDWKISQSDTSDYTRQALTYTLAILKAPKWSNLQPEDIQVYEVNLLTDSVRQYTITQDKLYRIEDFIFQSATEVQAVVGNHGYSLDQFEDYDSANSPLTCQHCNFRKLCLELNHG
jgi:hypothetical protein